MTQPALIDGIRSQMKYLAERQRVLAQNIANSETPGYKSMDVAAPSFAALVEGAGASPSIAKPSVTLTAGMAALGARQPISASSLMPDGDVSETKPDGNNVTLEDQMLKLGQTQADFATATSIYRKQLGLINTALGRSGSN